MQRVQIGFLGSSKAAVNRSRKPNVARGAALSAAVFLFGLTVSPSLGSATIDGVARIEQSDTAARRQILHGSLPLSFEANHGQSDPQVDFIARASGYTVFLTPRQAVLMLRGAARADRAEADAAVLRLQLVGANARPEVMGLEELPGRINYFRGNDPARWRTNIPAYAKVGYQEIYPGIDVVYYGNQRRLEYDFIIQPGSNPENIVLAFEGAEKVEIDREGDLLLHVAGGVLRHQKPAVYQDVDGARREIAGSYLMRSAREVGFTLAAYDKTRPLVIDPVLSYASYLGGADDDDAGGIAFDADGFAYITGGTASIDFPASPGAAQAFKAGLTDTFLTKIDPAGSSIIYSTYLGGTGDDDGRGVVVDGAGNVFIVGDTSSLDFPTTAGAFQLSLRGVGADGFITKLDTTGSVLVYSTYLGGADDDEALGIAVDASGNAYITGETSSTDFPTSFGALKGTLSGLSDAYVAKLDPNGAALVYSTYLGGTGDDDTRSIAVDVDGNAYVTGETLSTNFPTTPGAFRTTLTSAPDAFVAKLEPAGTALVYSTYLGGRGGDRGFAIALDRAPNPNAYVAGRTSSTNFPVTPGAFQTILAGTGVRFDAFVTKIDPTGSTLVYSTYLGGGGGDEQAHSVAVDTAGHAYVTGQTLATNFPTTVDALQPARLGAADAFITKLNSTGSALVYSTYFGGGGEDSGFGISVDAFGSAYVAGETLSTDLRTTAGAFDTTFNGTEDGFVVKIADFGPSASLALDPAASSTTVGTGHCVTTTTRDAMGRAVPGVTVRYAVTGSHSGSSAAQTDAAGQATFCYTGTAAGDDSITAYADTNHSSIADPGEPSATATNSWTAP